MNLQELIFSLIDQSLTSHSILQFLSIFDLMNQDLNLVNHSKLVKIYEKKFKEFLFFYYQYASEMDDSYLVEKHICAVILIFILNLPQVHTILDSFNFYFCRLSQCILFKPELIFSRILILPQSSFHKHSCLAATVSFP